MPSLYLKNEYPFLFRVCSKDVECSMDSPEHYRSHGHDRFYVDICAFDYRYYNAEWACDDRIGKNPLTLDLDIIREDHEFGSEAEALGFIRDWWKTQ
jgi:hypothetical protein